MGFSNDLNAHIQYPILATHQGYHFKTLPGFFCQGERANKTERIFLSLDPRCCGVPDPRLSFLPEKDIRIICSFNELLLCLGNYEVLYVCNPVTQKFKQLPDPGVFGFSANKAAMVLGYEPFALNLEANYELVSAVKFPDEPVLRFGMYLSINETWRESKNFLPLDEHVASKLSFTGNTFYFKGIAYWETSSEGVVAFDMKNEYAEMISLPDETGENGVFGQINGEICYLCIFPGKHYTIKIYNIAKKALQHEISFVPDKPLRRSPWILPGFDGATVRIHAELTIYSCPLDDDAITEFRRSIDVPMELDFSNRRRYFEYINTLAPVLIDDDPYEDEEEEEDEDEERSL